MSIGEHALLYGDLLESIKTQLESICADIAALHEKVESFSRDAKSLAAADLNEVPPARWPAKPTHETSHLDALIEAFEQALPEVGTDIDLTSFEPAEPDTVEPLVEPISDDFTLICGIDAEAEQTLAGFDIFHFADLAALDDDEALAIGVVLGDAERVLRESWIAQADILASGGLTAYAQTLLRPVPELAPSLFMPELATDAPDQTEAVASLEAADCQDARLEDRLADSLQPVLGEIDRLEIAHLLVADDDSERNKEPHDAHLLQVANAAAALAAVRAEIDSATVHEAAAHDTPDIALREAETRDTRTDAYEELSEPSSAAPATSVEPSDAEAIVHLGEPEAVESVQAADTEFGALTADNADDAETPAAAPSATIDAIAGPASRTDDNIIDFQSHFATARPRRRYRPRAIAASALLLLAAGATIGAVRSDWLAIDLTVVTQCSSELMRGNASCVYLPASLLMTPLDVAQRMPRA
jgi:predicted flap endonuclease-1-like 5' DNA nuclease